MQHLIRSLLRVSGVGPRIALGILSGISVEALMLCIEAQDPDPLVRVPGVGRKTAERVLIDMRDRVKDLTLGPGAALAAGAGQGAAQHEAHSALLALGYRPAEIVRLLRAVAAEGGSTEELIRRALQAAAT